MVGSTSYNVIESVLEVDEHNWPVGKVSRKEMRKKNLWHRASYIYVKNSKNELCIHLRTKNKEYCPDMWDVSLFNLTLNPQNLPFFPKT